VSEIYGLDAEIVAPPVAVPAAMPASEDLSDVLVVARLLPYKHVDVAVAVAALAPDLRVHVVGDGPLMDQLSASANPNVSFLGALDDEALWREYTGTKVHLALSYEDFGITPLEAAAAARPTVARRFGGYLDTISSETGLLMDEHDLSPATVLAALRAALARPWDDAALRAHAASFSPQRHLERLGAITGVAPQPR
jgi:glycosyltransferase involved in cell wall biosynthesis